MKNLKKTILIIEDQVDILSTLKEILEVEKFKVLTAHHGAEAMALLENQRPDLIILDMKMPIMDGWEFAGEFHQKHPGLCPILVMTAAGDAAKRAKDVKAIDWIEKPFDVEQLVSKIKTYV